MNVLVKENAFENHAGQLYHYFDGTKWVEKWEKTNVDVARVVMENHIQELEPVHTQVLTGHLSPLAYHIQVYSFDVKLLSYYTGIPKRLIKKHLKPKYFNQLDETILEKYAVALGFTVEELKKV
jgi:hypothetical protein